jgi:hypothetical protein
MKVVIVLGADQGKQFDQLSGMLEKSSAGIYQYWLNYSSPSTWQFWLLLGLLVLPLVALYFLIDRDRALLFGFYGFNVHVWFLYSDTYGATHRLWNYPYKVIPFLPTNITLDSSLVPVSFMLLYQWILRNNKSYYLYTALLAALFAFLFKPALATFGFFRMYRGMNYVYLFVLYVAIAFLSKWITNLFVHFEKQGNKPAKARSVKLNRLFPLKQKAK